MNQSREKVIRCYDNAASVYAAQFIDEMSKKHFDRMILKEFAAENRSKGPMLDLGCGPGQTTAFLYECGVEDIIGIDISTGMVDNARQYFPAIPFEAGDMLNLNYANSHFGSAIAFYSIVHFPDEQLEAAFAETGRVLKTGGHFLFSFHIGTEAVHQDNFMGKGGDIDFYFFETEKALDKIVAAGFRVIDGIERHPYPDVEYPSRRAYIWVEKK